MAPSGVRFFTDFSKAFYTNDQITIFLISNNIPAVKLKCLRFCNLFLSWFVSFITIRKLYVKYKKLYSNKFNVTYGVPQGSHLPPSHSIYS